MYWSDGTGTWKPQPHSRICSRHFVGNKKSDESNSPSYNPSIFPPGYKKKTAAIDCQGRYERLSKRRAEKFSSTIQVGQEESNQAYGGRATDAFITVDSGLLSLLDPGDVVLADKGFPGVRVDAAEADGILVVPPFASGGNFTAEEMAETYNIASVRIHVERMIQRVKNFINVNIRLPIELHDHVDQVMHVICVLANLQSSIFKQCEY
ncbi:hypothetical protein HPB48_009851 [Haemaphysalis longicornis]|uniref:DDE Tnp4 domain-containing protein n=1 Tax=Haemaphysalis longicornis TaxID=44386 RepID=A0A9J6GVV4_HAELO|nr:hypothetical protein HPB48_009851 [Haemaphysalis longicornis]